MMRRANPSNQKPNQEEDNLAMSLKLALLGGILTTLGDAIATFAAKIAIEESLQENLTQTSKNNEQENRIKSMENQIQVLQKKLDDLPK
ncbi:hypothetical protein [Shouchella hunanensis]|uniref:Translation initiation factor 2 n=1 Tax=Shouchella hunanensis TaxID=766894 RepID=A0ABY7WCQ1_9BACI|nr:hypothetical protein [Shouchella hunanensis]WDF05562.1 hypothetical protein PQ477_09030 [Shouchella hunanensis]GAF21654.1 hypothetical protein JCM19047_1349 [Bacillus sp. JCM 19047]